MQSYITSFKLEELATQIVEWLQKLAIIRLFSLSLSRQLLCIIIIARCFLLLNITVVKHALYIYMT